MNEKDFTVLSTGIIYMDSSCVSLKPTQVVSAINAYYDEYPACGGRSSHRLGLKVTNKVKEVRKKIAKFFNASKTEEIIFTKNSTEGINIVAQGFSFVEGDKILLSDKEHNSNLVPWQILAKKKNLEIVIFRFNDIEDFKEKIKGIKFVSTVHVSNLDGSSQNVEEMIKIAHKEGAKILIDGAQSAAHHEVNLKKLDCDFFVCSGHKMLGPSGTGILYGKMSELENLSPFITGGETVRDSFYDKHVIDDIPYRFEAGLQNYAGIAGLGAAVDYLSKIGLKKIHEHEIKLNKIITDGIKDISGLKILGPENPEDRSGVISISVDGMDPHDIALQLDSQANIMIRSGHHCCHSWFNANNVNGSARVSLYFYNTEEEARKLVDSLKNIIEMLR